MRARIGLPRGNVVYKATDNGEGIEAHRFCAAGGRVWGPHVRPFLARYL